MKKKNNFKKIKILIVDDHNLVREGFAKMLGLEEEFTVIGQASSAKEALDKIKILNPNIILMDIKLPDLNGIECTQLIKKEHPEIKVIILSMYDEVQYVLESVKSGATGYLLKDISREELVHSIKIVYAGGSLIQPDLAHKVLKNFTKNNSLDLLKNNIYKELSLREKEILQWIADGKTNKEAAEVLYISEKTVKSHLRTIFRKLEVTDRAQAVAYAMRKGWVG
ncbi:MAG: response regulator transcription factor [Armatimonadetes bacterium]|nr:response regulator transcription factor [Armatimonadota bacterium]